MARTLEHARAEAHEISTKCLRVINDNSLTAAQQKAKLDVLDPALEAARQEVKNWEHVHAERKRIFGDGGPETAASQHGAQIFEHSPFGTVKSAAALAPLNLSEYDLRRLHESVASRKSFKLSIDTKVASAEGYAVPAQGNPVAAMPEPTRIMSLFPGTGMDSPVVQFVRINGTTSPATPVAPGGLKPNVGLDSELLEARATKLAGLLTADDESLSDFAGWAQMLSVELANAVISAENLQLLSGDGTGLNMTGVLATSGVLTHAKGADTPLDAIEIAIQMIRSGASHADATGIVINALDLSAIRRSKSTGSGAYLAADPIGGVSSTLWDIPVVVTTDIAVGTCLVGAFQLGGQVYVREGLSVQTGAQTGDFEHNLTTLRGEERIALAITRPSAFCVVTGLAS